MNEDMDQQQGVAPAIEVSSTPVSPEPEIRLKVAVVEKLNLADFQNAVPALHELAIVNETLTPISELTITITSEPAFLKPRTWSMDTVGAGETFHIADLDVQLDGALLSRLTEAEPATLHFELRSRNESETVIAQHDRVVELLARNQWGGIGYAPEMVAAFVQPNDPAVDHVLKAAAQALQASGKSGSIDGYTHGAKRAWELASGIWTAVLQRKLHYALPPASFEHRGQKVRSPGQIHDAGLATCLDLTLLFASCLEQANLNPLLIFTHGHAFVGLWLRDEEFSSAVVDDITAVRKRLQLQEMLVFETTLAAQGHAVSFSQAISQGNRQLSEDEDDKFELVVDVKRARMSRVKPLAVAHAVADQALPIINAPEAAIALEDAPDLPDEVQQEIPTAELDPKDRLARWQRKLLDLSLRNALLNFKQGKKALQLDVDAPTLEDALAEGQTLKLLPNPELMQGRDPRSQQLHEARSLEDLRKAHAADALKRREVFIRLGEQELDGRLVDLYRGARNALQEGGANTLFLALGFLVWTRPDKPDHRVKAPLILLPVTLDRKSVRSGFSIRAHDDEPRFNPTLVEMLRQDFQLELGVPQGDLPRDDSGLDIAGIWKRVRAAIKDIRGWEVSEDVVLSMFSFAKYLMWKDLAERTEDLRKSPVVAHLIDTPREPYQSTVPFPEARRLDVDYTPQQVFTPLPADSSQLSAVMAAAKGKDFVLIGPPGTGKSQTIANLIAQCLAEDKRVLFVAEKIAALDVVYRRLREVGLGEFCLELHSNKTRKLDVLAQLQKSWESRGEEAADWAAKAQQLGRIREQLSTYVERLHHRHRNGLTVYRAIGSIVGGDNIPDLRFSWSSQREHDEAALAALRELAGRLQANAIAVGSHNLSAGPLTPVHLSDWSARWQQEMVRAAQTLGECCDRLIAASHELCEQLGFDVPVLQRNVRSSLGVIAKALLQAAGKAWSFCVLPQSAELCAELKVGGGLLSQHCERSAQMSAAWAPELLTQLHQALDLLGQYRRIHAELGVAWPTPVSDELQRGIQLIEEIAQLREGLSVKYGSGVAQLNVTLLQRDWAKAEKAFWPMSWLEKRKVRRTLESVIEGTDEPRVVEDLAALVKIKSLREELGELNLSATVEGLWAGEKTRTDHAQSALKANAALVAARAQHPFSLEGLSLAAKGYCGERWVAEVKRLAALQDLDRRITNCAPLAEASDGLWRGHETDVDLLRAALAFEQERLHLKDRGALQTEHPAIADGRCGSRLQQEHTRLQKRAALESQLAGMDSLASHCAGVWAGLDTNTDTIAQSLRFHSLLHAGLSGLGLPATVTDTMRQALHRVLVERVHELNDGAIISNTCQQMLARLAELNAALTAFSNSAGQPEEVKHAFADLTPDEMADVARQLDSAHAGLHAWCAWRNAQAAARDAGLTALVDAIEHGNIEPAHAPTAFEVNYARWWLAEAVDEDEVLKRFVSAEHERRISEFRALDEEFTKVSRQWIRAKLCADLPSLENLQRNSEWGVLRREITKKRMHLPLRQLLAETPSAVLRLTPCLLMSPLSIAQYLSADASSFDIVIFDEASQIPVWDAVGAMARGKQVVMVGDPKQLPPTNFFDRAEASDGDSEDVEGDLESILDECLGASLPTRNLSWHYRSRHESLIAFSNHRYYGGGLVTFPSPVTEDSAVSFHFVGGQYEKGGARINQPEARALVADLVARLKSPGFRQSGLTIGVVTFNSEQQGLIEDLLDAERRNDPSLESFFSEVELEPVFVKNLESVQGDERDVMYFSITYGPDMSGAMSMNFGPLNRDGGERRLNVAVTRARHELRVFSSLRGEQMDLSRTKAIGVRDLKHFLEFAERGARALAEAHHGSKGDFDSPFEAAVAAALGRKGWQVHTQIGASSFRIDLGVVHPDLPGRYLAGVECDGATYHRSATARDRDKLREQVLRGLGWEIERIWSTDWWVDPGGTLERVHARLSKLLAQDRERRTLEASAQKAASEAAQTVDESAPDTTAALEATLAIARAAAKTPESSQKIANEVPEPFYVRSAAESSGISTDRQFRPSQPEEAVAAGAVSAERFYDSAYDEVLIQMIEWVVQHEGPVLDAVLARRIARAHGFQRTGARIQERIEHLARQRFGSTEEATGSFYWPDGVPPGTEVTFRWPTNEDSTRGVEEICEQELLSLARTVINSGKSGEEALIAMAREIGLMKLRAASRGKLEAVLNVACR